MVQVLWYVDRLFQFLTALQHMRSFLPVPNMSFEPALPPPVIAVPLIGPSGLNRLVPSLLRSFQQSHQDVDRLFELTLPPPVIAAPCCCII